MCGPGEAHNVALGCVRHLGCSAECGCLLLCLPSSLLPAALPVLPFTSPNFTPFFAAKNAATTTSVGRSVGRWTCVRRRGDGNYRLLGKFLRAPMNWGRESFKWSRDSRISGSGSVTWWASHSQKTRLETRPFNGTRSRPCICKRRVPPPLAFQSVAPEIPLLVLLLYLE